MTSIKRKAILEYALEAFARHGRPILPVKEGDKFPPRFKWKATDEDGTTVYVGLDSEEAIRAWWSENPNDNYAIITGGDLVVVDIDVKTGNGFESLAPLGWPEDSFTVESPSGGQHRYFNTKGELVRTYRGFKPSVDIKGEGGYVLGPGSVIAEGQYAGDYEVVREGEVLPAPALLVDNGWLSACTGHTLLQSATRGGGSAQGTGEEWAKVFRALCTEHLRRGKSLRKVELPSFGAGERHNALLSCFGWLRNQWGWRSFEQWFSACEWVSDSITVPSFRLTASNDFQHLVQDTWVMEDEPKPLVEMTRQEFTQIARQATLEVELETNPLWKAIAFAPEYEGDDEIEYLVQDMVPFGSVVAIAALFKTGKSEFVSTLVKSVSEGTTFLGKPTKKSRVLYLTEERQGTFRLKADRYGFGYDVGIVHRTRLLNEATVSWEQAMDLASVLCAAMDFRVLVVDTFTRWAGLADENSNAEITKRMTPLEKVAEAGVAVIVVHQHGKSAERQNGLSMRGGSAFGDAVDVFIELFRIKGKPREHPERLMSLAGRITEFSWIVNFDPALGYYFVQDASGQTAVLSQSPREVRMEEIRSLLDIRGELSADALVADGTNWLRTTASRYLNDMRAAGELVREYRSTSGGRQAWFKRA